ncbi:hypothetical protein [Lactobacillus sp. ESL0681]|uniref:hypothetical protein n=1 Tax=Lactobacillus sp. ESL0681 TaxID=2983211 RepID=UPI0023F82D35|nr:hypothetical protein [Lactobacillus sp. ESL0681]WEV40323.1 hypothetical protein OZX59_09165 [Lactobacillus sp. ESL0681]
MTWSTFISIASMLLTGVSLFVNRRNNERNNQTIKDIELTKEGFARENEKLKREQHLQDKKNELISNFLSSINTFDGVMIAKNQEQALSDCGKVLPILSPDKAKVVNDLISVIQSINTTSWLTEKEIQKIHTTIKNATVAILK